MSSRTEIVEEESQQSLWMKQLYAGVGAYFGVGVALWIYIASTWATGPHRLGILVVTLLGMAPVPWILRYRRTIIEGPIRQPFFVAWNMACYAMILVMTWLDGGITSPIAWLWFLPTIYLLFGYSTQAIRLCAPFGLLMYLLSAWLTPGALPGSLFVMQLVLLADSLVMVWLGARSRDEREARVSELRERLALLASTDALTGCLNQRAFGRLVTTAFASAARGDQLALLAFDVDHFKAINDRHGHVMGDEVLRQLGGCLRDLIRHDDVACRLGGDEFVVLCPRTTVGEAIRLAERLRTAAAKLPVPVAFTLSVGICAMPSEGGDVETLRRRADRALYAAKRQGRNRSVLFGVVEESPTSESGEAMRRTGNR